MSPDTPSNDVTEATYGALTDPIPNTIVYKLRSGYDLNFKLEVTAGDVIVSTLLAFLIVTILIMFFHKLILGRRG